jgi:hypothetical protein
VFHNFCNICWYKISLKSVQQFSHRYIQTKSRRQANNNSFSNICGKDAKKLHDTRLVPCISSWGVLCLANSLLIPPYYTLPPLRWESSSMACGYVAVHTPRLLVTASPSCWHLQKTITIKNTIFWDTTHSSLLKVNCVSENISPPPSVINKLTPVWRQVASGVYLPPAWLIRLWRWRRYVHPKTSGDFQQDYTTLYPRRKYSS